MSEVREGVTSRDAEVSDPLGLRDVVAKREKEIPVLERKLALIALARIAERDVVPTSELKTLSGDYVKDNPHLKSREGDSLADFRDKLAQIEAGVPRDQARTALKTDKEERTTRDSKLRQDLREIERLSKLTRSEGRVRSITRKLRYAGGARNLAKLRQKRIVDLTPDQLKELDIAETSFSASGEMVIRGKRELLARNLDLTMGELYDTYGEEIIGQRKNTAALYKSANWRLISAAQDLSEAQSHLQK